MIHQHKFNRRPVLQGLGGITLGLPSLNCFTNPNNTNHAPMRMVCVGTNFGFAPQLFSPTEIGKNYHNSRYLKPLEPLKHKLSFFSNLDHGKDLFTTHGLIKVIRILSAKKRILKKLILMSSF